MSNEFDEDERSGGLRPWVVVYLKGLAMGLADAIPGVSGGTIALIVGIYDRLIDAIAGISERGSELVDDVVTGGNPGRLEAVSGTLRSMDVPFLVVLGLGVLTGVVALANVIHYALHTYRALTFAFFFGIILASPVVLRDEVELRDQGPLAAGIVGGLLAFWVSGLPRQQADYALPAMFLIGAVAICAMVLPGISGSLVLLVIGAYDTMTGAVSELTHAVAGAASGGELDGVVGPLSVLVVFAAGALVGLLTFARVVSWALDAHRAATMTFFVGVIIGALRTPYREIVASVEVFTPPTVAVLVATGVVGALVVLGLEYVTGGIE